MSRRDPYFDIVKAVAISMVVFCHVMSIAPAGTFPTWINNFRVGMNMPVFFILSGYFAWSTIEAHDWRKLVGNIRSYFQPALFAGIVYTIIGIAIGLVALEPRAIFVRLLRSIFVDPWFLTTLAECYTCLFVSLAIGRRTHWALVIVVCALLMIMCRPSFVNGGIHFSCLLSMMPHFVFGAVVLRKFGLKVWENWKIGIPCLAAFVAFTLLEGDVEENGMSFYTADSTIRTFGSLKSCICFLLRPIVGILGSIGVMSLLRVMFDAIPFLGCIAKIGTLTLGIYIFHLWPLGRLRGVA